ncbi:Binding-protein-dependent transport system inner membrane component [Caprobacter fermentans]|uniref:Maltose/maltodextrin transport system permease protein n=1 Tax=Caproicibacter fermentans TaxID=2576756 RepID=A0A6N8I0X7_9FIRM|nr:sugar ABC transporter permease [Caproicibacter fermentans]MVB11609.1 Binding-protein-dependent transport system inner membrane component [Caproicibacter fermentans]
MTKKSSSTILSCLFWGSGQFFIGKQKVKGILFFAAQVLLFGIELFSGYWFNFFAGQISNFQIRLYGGWFTRGIWGLFTLGTVPGEDHSTYLMINGIMWLIFLIVFLGIYIWNIVDAYRTGKAIDDTQTYLSSRAYGKKLYQKMFPYLVLAPILFVVLYIVVMPIIFSVLTAFTNYNANHLPPANLVKWVGLDNFSKLISIPIWSQTFLIVLAWTVIWAFIATFSTYFLGLFQALLINSKCVKHKSFFRSIYILPWAIPGMISLLMFRNLFNGQFSPLNQLLLDCGLIHSRIPFLSDAFTAKITIIAVNLWMGFPMFMAMLLGVLANQDPTLYEAAGIDGANKFQIFRRIKLPLLMKATAPLLVMNFIGNFNGFGFIYFLTNGGPNDSSLEFAGDTDILISWIYKLTLNQNMYNLAAVLNILIFILVGVVSYWNLKNTAAIKEM